MFILGITGTIGSGKSTVANYFKQKNILVLDADEISHQVTGREGRALASIEEAFGSDYFDGEGNLRRDEIAQLVFSHRPKLDLLSQIIHQFVMEEIEISLQKAAKEKVKLIVLDVPIPVKRGFLDVCHQIWVVTADPSLRVERLKTRGMGSEEDIKRRMAMQMTEEEYIKLGHLVLYNNGSLEEFITQIESAITQEILSRGIRL